MTKTTLFFSFFAALLIISCTRPHLPITGVPEIDVTLRFPEREINLADIAYVTYVHLCTSNDDFLFGGTIEYVTENRLIVVDQSSGSVLFFSKEGTPISRFNRLGQGPEEHFDRSVSVAYDEATDEVFLFSVRQPFIPVYSSTGEFKRRLEMPPGIRLSQLDIFDSQLLIMFDIGPRLFNLSSHDTPYTNFFLICRTDGQFVYQIPILASDVSLSRGTGTPATADIVRHPDGFLLCDPATDTVFLFCRNRALTPVLWKTPPAGSSPRRILDNVIDSRYFQFFRIMNLDDGQRRHYVRDKQTGRIYRQNITLPGFQGRRFTICPHPQTAMQNGTYIQLCLQELKEAYEQNQLSGELKELVSTLCEWSSNDVWALIQFH